MGKIKHQGRAKVEVKPKTITKAVADEAEEFGKGLLALFGQDRDLIRFTKLYMVLLTLEPAARRESGWSDDLMADLVVFLSKQFFHELNCAVAKKNGDVFHQLGRTVEHFPQPGARDMTFMRLYKLSQSPGFKDKQWNTTLIQKATGDPGNLEVLRRKAVAFGMSLKPGKPGKLLLASHHP